MAGNRRNPPSQEIDDKVSKVNWRASVGVRRRPDLATEIREAQFAIGRLDGLPVIQLDHRASCSLCGMAHAPLGDFRDYLRSRILLGAFVSDGEHVQVARLRHELSAELQARWPGPMWC